MIKWLKRLFTKERYMSKYTDEQNRQIDEEVRESIITQQKRSDNKWDEKIASEANRLFEEWKVAKVYEINGKKYNSHIAVGNFGTGVYLIYDHNTAKYLHGGQDKRVMEIYRELIEEYENKLIQDGNS